MTEEKETFTQEEILKDVTKVEVFSEQPKMGYAGIWDSDDRWRRLFKKIGPNQYEEVDVKSMVRMISEYLAKHMTLEKLLNDKLLHQPLETILGLHERVKSKGEVKEKVKSGDCYFLEVKGKQGKPLEVEL